MDRTVAARVLGVTIDADRAEVQAAFRRKIRLVHPDLNDGPDADLDVLATARDTLLLPAGSESASTQPRSTHARSMPAASSSSDARPKRTGYVWGAVLAAGVLACIVAAGLLLLALTGGDAESGFVAGDCVIVLPSGVEVAGCDAPEAQRVVQELVEPGACDAGTDAILVGSTVWCLDPISPG